MQACSYWGYCSTIWGCATNKNYYYTNIVCIQLVLHWGANWECGINQGNMVYGDSILILSPLTPQSMNVWNVCSCIFTNPFTGKHCENDC